MSQAVLIRSGSGFKTFIHIIANPGDTVNITGPKGIVDSVSIGSTGTLDYLVRKKGSWEFVGVATGVRVTLNVLSRKETYIANVSFSSTLRILGNANDRVAISGPSNFNTTVTIPASGIYNQVVILPGTYTATGAESAISTSVNATATGQTYDLVVSFSATVTVTTNPSVTVTLKNTSGTTVQYSANATAAGVATITVKRKGGYIISSTAATSNTVSSTNSVTSVTASNSGGKYTAIFVKVSNCTSIVAGQYNSNTAYVYWNLASTTYYTGMRVQYKIGGYPSSVSDGTNIGHGTGSARNINASNLNRLSFQTGALSIGTTYYFTGWPFVRINNVDYYGTSRTSYVTMKTTAFTGKIFTSSTTWTIPDGVRSLSVCCVGGGGGGGVGMVSANMSGCGGGGGYVAYASYNVIPGQVATISIGHGGAAQASNYSERQSYPYAGKIGGSGGATTFAMSGQTTLSGNGGEGGGVAYATAFQPRGGNGGSGGGAGAFTTTDSDFNYPSTNAGAGGTNGSAGGSTSNKFYTCSGGAGQGGANGTSFNGVAYSGGGGGGRGGAGGSGGGGAGGNKINSAAGSGTGGTGGGGGGAFAMTGSSASSFWVDSGAGGTGVCIVNAA